MIPRGLFLIFLLPLCIDADSLISKPLIMAHRAGAQLVPENTIDGWRVTKILCHPDVWELDIHFSADDSLMVIHDETVDRTTDGAGLIREMTCTELRKLDAAFWFTPDSGATYPWRGKGVRVPTLAEVFDSFPADRFNIEIKDSILHEADSLVALIERKDMQGRVVVASVYKDVIERVRALDPGIVTSGSEDEIRPLVLLQKMGLGFVAKRGLRLVQVPEYSGSVHVVTPGFVRLCHKKGIEVHVWTINSAAEIEHLLKIGVDGIITDRPDVALRVAKALGLREFATP